MSEDRVVEGLAAEVQRLREGIAIAIDRHMSEHVMRDALRALLDGEADR